ncbi:glycosyltransferase family 2 protein [Knoellia locipacati]|uniref:glycosyltransferase family 2 protein n=1 Tax=Knoellia locipacati TaxID=882824 RepID=UPI00164B3092|nr:glycosyltransferase family 2 protein [Knoellia locipacati]
MAPVLTIVVPVFNVEEYLPATLRSLAPSLGPEVELVLVDDGSTDDSLRTGQRVLDELGVTAYRLLRLDNGGVSVARNVGLRAATGDYVLFLDGDDQVSPNFFATVRAALAPATHDIVCWRYRSAARDGASQHAPAPAGTPVVRSLTGADAFEEFLGGRLDVWTGSAAYSRTFLERSGVTFTEGCVAGQDREFIHKAFGVAASVAHVDATCSFWIQRTRSITHSFNIRRFDAVEAHRRAFDFLEERSVDVGPGRDVDELRNRAIVGHYFFNLRSCIRSAQPADRRRILALLDASYPGLNAEIRQRVSVGSPSFETRLYVRAPRLYTSWVVWRGGVVEQLVTAKRTALAMRTQLLAPARGRHAAH